MGAPLVHTRSNPTMTRTAPKRAPAAGGSVLAHGKPAAEPSTALAKSTRRRSKKHACREIILQQRSVKNCISTSGFRRLVRGIASDCGTPMRFTDSAFKHLQAGTESALVSLFLHADWLNHQIPAKPVPTVGPRALQAAVMVANSARDGMDETGPRVPLAPPPALKTLAAAPATARGVKKRKQSTPVKKGGAAVKAEPAAPAVKPEVQPAVKVEAPMVDSDSD